MSDLVKRDPILDQFSMITRPYTRLNGLKTIPFPAANIRIANILGVLPYMVDLVCQGAYFPCPLFTLEVLFCFFTYNALTGLFKVFTFIYPLFTCTRSLVRFAYTDNMHYVFTV